MQFFVRIGSTSRSSSGSSAFRGVVATTAISAVENRANLYLEYEVNADSLALSQQIMPQRIDVCLYSLRKRRICHGFAASLVVT
jgi:hypothetical protein